MSPLFALFNRSLRQDVRAKSTYWARAGLVALMFTMMLTTHASMGWAGAPGLRFFAMVISTNYLFISLAGLSFFSSAITEEKEEMTLGLLRMTNLNPLSILLGKSTSRLFGGLLLLAAQLPFTLLAVSFGGISLTQILAAYCALMAYVIFLSNVALLASVVAARTAAAALLTGLLLVIFHFGHYLISLCLQLFYWMGLASSREPGITLETVLNGWQAIIPSTRFAEVLTTGFSGGLLGPQIYGNLALGALCFALAWGGFDFFCRDQKDAAPRRGLLFKGGAKKKGVAGMLRRFGAGRPWKHALIWKDYHFLAGGHLGFLLKMIVYGALPFLGVLVGSDFSTARLEYYGHAYVWPMLIALIAESSIISGRVFRQERRWQTLSSLAMLPFSIRRIAYQKVFGCLIGCVPAFFYFLMGWGLLAAANWDDLMKSSVSSNTRLLDLEWQAVFAMISVVALFFFFFHLVADLSLRFKWGALPMAIALTWLLNTIGLPLSVVTMGEASFAAVPIVLIGATLFLHHRIGRRLEQLAAEE
ncbi:MAG: hypothetical protein V4710_17655 [Verrucomicrobiota bacterium]